MVDCKDGDLSAVFCNTTFCQHCSSSCSFFHGNDPRIILLPWQPLVNLVWPSPVIQCLSIHLHSLHLCLSCCKLPVFIYIYIFFTIAHILLFTFFFLYLHLCGCIMAAVTQAVNTSTQADVILQGTVCSYACTGVLQACFLLWLSGLS